MNMETLEREFPFTNYDCCPVTAINHNSVTEAMLCSKCGCSLLANAKYCHICGQATDTSSSVAVSSSSVVTNSGTA